MDYLNTPGYNLPRDAAESRRLDNQDRLYVDTLGFRVHSSVKLPPKAKIADLGTGTGIFLVRLLEEYPDASMTGYDISDLQFPAKPSPQLTLQTHDVTQPFPEAVRGTFDLVHLRLVAQAFAKNTWPTVIANILGLLKPRGYLQWEESDYFFEGYMVGEGAAKKAFNTVEAMVSELQWDRESEFARDYAKLIPGVVAEEKRFMAGDHKTRAANTLGIFQAAVGKKLTEAEMVEVGRQLEAGEAEWKWVVHCLVAQRGLEMQRANV